MARYRKHTAFLGIGSIHPIDYIPEIEPTSFSAIGKAILEDFRRVKSSGILDKLWHFNEAGRKTRPPKKKGEK